MNPWERKNTMSTLITNTKKRSLENKAEESSPNKLLKSLLERKSDQEDPIISPNVEEALGLPETSECAPHTDKMKNLESPEKKLNTLLETDRTIEHKLDSQPISKNPISIGLTNLVDDLDLSETENEEEETRECVPKVTEVSSPLIETESAPQNEKQINPEPPLMSEKIDTESRLPTTLKLKNYPSQKKEACTSLSEETIIEISEEENEPSRLPIPKNKSKFSLKKPKSKEFIEDDSSDSCEETKKETKLIPPLPLKHKYLKTAFSSANLQQCTYILVKGSRKGERCTNKQSKNLCAIHDKDKKDGSVSKKYLIELVEETKKENQIMRQEVLNLKKHNIKLENEEKLKEDNKKETEVIKRNIACLKRIVCGMRQNKTKEGQSVGTPAEKIFVNEKLKELEFKLNEIASKKISTPTFEKVKKVPRRRLSKLNVNKIYTLVRYCSLPRHDSKEAVFKCEDGMFKVQLPNMFERKCENEGWTLRYSMEDKRFQWCNP